MKRITGEDRGRLGMRSCLVAVAVLGSAAACSGDTGPELDAESSVPVIAEEEAVIDEREPSEGVGEATPEEVAATSTEPRRVSLRELQSGGVVLNPVDPEGLAEEVIMVSRPVIDPLLEDLNFEESDFYVVRDWEGFDVLVAYVDMSCLLTPRVTLGTADDGATIVLAVEQAPREVCDLAAFYGGVAVRLARSDAAAEVEATYTPHNP